MILDIHDTIQDFKNAGFNEAQAKVLADKLRIKREENPITKDLVIVEQNLRSEIQEFRHELKSDVQELRHELHETRISLESKIVNISSQIKIDMLKWLIPMFLTTILTMGAMVSPLWLNKDVREAPKAIDNIKK